MNEYLTKWLEALRSGEHQQGKGRLKSDQGYCCLGVLCEASGKGEWEYDLECNSFTYVESPYDIQSAYAPKSLLDELELPSAMTALAGDIRVFSDQLTEDELGILEIWEEADCFNISTNSNQDLVTVSKLNDLGFTLSQIADRIERTYNYFKEVKENA